MTLREKFHQSQRGYPSVSSIVEQLLMLSDNALVQRIKAEEQNQFLEFDKWDIIADLLEQCAEDVSKAGTILIRKPKKL